MNFDLIASIELTASAAIAIAVLSIGFGGDPWARIRIAVGLSVWFVVVTILAAIEVFHYQRGFGVPGLGIAVVLPIIVLSLGLLWHGGMHRALNAIPLSMLIGVNVVRILGVSFLILYADGRLPGPFAPVAGWGDILIGLTALPVAWLFYRKGATIVPTVWVWNTLGLLDLMAAIGLGVVSSPGPLRLIFTEPGSALMTSLPWLLIPGFLVPLLATTHLAIFYRLRRESLVATRAAPVLNSHP